MIKPVSKACQLDCDYCFYHRPLKEAKSELDKQMSIELLEAVIKKGIKAADRELTITFQGGEPTLAGLDFYKEAVKLIDKYNDDLRINKHLQTNGVSIDQDWAKFLADNNFLVGLSLDGPKEIHNSYRSNYEEVKSCLNLFKRCEVDYNILTVVTSQVASQPAEVYNFFRRQGVKHLQFIPCIPTEDKFDYSLTSKLYLSFLKTIFACWAKDIRQENLISIKYFDSLVKILLGYPPQPCKLRERCSFQFVIEAEGSVYPCDFYLTDQFKLGNIGEKDFIQLSRSKKLREFIAHSRVDNKECNDCKYYYLCRGGCKKYRSSNLNYFCNAYKEFFSYSEQELKNLARFIYKRGRENL
jgi:uncharacterized protein